MPTHQDRTPTTNPNCIASGLTTHRSTFSLGMVLRPPRVPKPLNTPAWDPQQDNTDRGPFELLLPCIQFHLVLPRQHQIWEIHPRTAFGWILCYYLNYKLERFLLTRKKKSASISFFFFFSLLVEYPHCFCCYMCSIKYGSEWDDLALGLCEFLI